MLRSILPIGLFTNYKMLRNRAGALPYKSMASYLQMRFAIKKSAEEPVVFSHTWVHVLTALLLAVTTTFYVNNAIRMVPHYSNIMLLLAAYLINKQLPKKASQCKNRYCTFLFY